MLKELLKEEQPLVYEALSTALSNGTLSHALLFAGPDVTCKKEAAILLAMSLLCENREDGFACETCNTCRRVKENGHMDFVLLDGTQRAISKDDADALQSDEIKNTLQKLGPQLCSTVIPYSAVISEAAALGRPVMQYDKSSNGARAYLALAGELISRLHL